MATGIASWSKTASSNASADSAVNWAEGMAPSAVNDSGRGMMASTAKWRDDISGALTTGGSSTAYTVTTNQVFASASAMDGAMLCIIPHTTSGAAPTLAVDGLTARNINMATGVNVTTGALKSGTPYALTYVHASTEFILQGVLDKRPLTESDIAGAATFSDPAVGDLFAAYDLSATANKAISFSDYLKLINSLTADASPDSAADYVATYDASASGPKKVLLSALPSSSPRGYIDGCIISNNSGDATNDIDIAAGVCRDSTNAVDIVVPAISGKQLDANWAAGGSAGMRNSAVGIADTTYHIWAVRTAASSAADIYAHTSATASTVLTALQAETGGSSYAYLRRIGSIIRSSSAILGFVQDGGGFQLKSIVQNFASTPASTNAISRTVTVPSGVRVRADLIAGIMRGSSSYAIISDLSTTDQTPSSAVFTVGIVLGTDSQLDTSCIDVWTDTSAQVRTRVDSTITTLYLNTRGWFDPRGQNA